MGDSLGIDALINLFPNMVFLQKDANSVYIDGTEAFAQLYGFKNRLEIEGKTDFDGRCKAAEFAPYFQQEDKLVLKNKKVMQVLNIMEYANQKWKILLGTKMPVCDKANRWSVYIHAQDILPVAPYLMQAFKKMNAAGIIQESFVIEKEFLINQENISIQLTPRESETLFFILRGQTAKQIALSLGLSTRTVEQYIEQLRVKFNCHSKSELIAKAVDQGALNLIPNQFLYHSHYLDSFK